MRARHLPSAVRPPATPRRAVSLRGVFLALLLMALPFTPLRAQDEENPPQRNGNIWNSIPHQPKEMEVAPEERALGVAPSVQQEKALNEELDTIGRQMLEDESAHPPRIPPPPPGMD
jgi:hypothetical protein